MECAFSKFYAKTQKVLLLESFVVIKPNSLPRFQQLVHNIHFQHGDQIANLYSCSLYAEEFLRHHSTHSSTNEVFPLDQSRGIDLFRAFFTKSSLMGILFLCFEFLSLDLMSRDLFASVS